MRWSGARHKDCYRRRDHVRGSHWVVILIEGTCGSRALALSLALALGTAYRCAADGWAGSLSVTSDYFVRGLSRSADRAALQFDVHYLGSSGFVAGLFGSNADIDPELPSDVELDAFLGFAWAAGNDGRGRILASHYAYPWNKLGASYDYDELSVELGFEDWLDLAVTYSPSAPRYIAYRGLIGVSSEAAEINLQRTLLAHLSPREELAMPIYQVPIRRVTATGASVLPTTSRR